MKLIETKPIIKRSMERSLNPYSSDLVEVSRVVGHKILPARRTLSKAKRRKMKNSKMNIVNGIALGRLNVWGNRNNRG